MVAKCSGRHRSSHEPGQLASPPDQRLKRTHHYEQMKLRLASELFCFAWYSQSTGVGQLDVIDPILDSVRLWPRF